MRKKITRHVLAKDGFYLFRILVFLLLCSSTLSAQSNSISGIVTDSEGLPLPGANVLQKGTNKVVVTNFDGKYTIQLEIGKQILIFSYLRYDTKEVSVKGLSKKNVSLSEDQNELDEIVVIGYGEVKRADVNGAVGSVKSEALMQVAPVNALEGMQGRVAGVQITSDGGPDSGSEIQIRGISTFGAGTQPLYIVDGQQVDDIDNINPSDIQTIDVLKDGASAAIYGSKAANGVVLVTTKQGKPGFSKMTVDYISSYSFLNNLVPVSNTRQWNKFEKLRTGSTDDSGAVVDSLGIRSQLVVDVQDAIKQVGQKNQLNLAFSGGSEKSKFYWNTSYLDESGIVIGSGFNRITSNLKVDFDLNKTVTAGMRINGTYQLQDGIN